MERKGGKKGKKSGSKRLQIRAVRSESSELESPDTERSCQQNPLLNLNVTKKAKARGASGSESESSIDPQSPTDVYSSDDPNLVPPIEKQLIRSVSLQPGEPSTSKKVVHFADTMGLELAEVKKFSRSKVPEIPRSAFADLKLEVKPQVVLPCAKDSAKEDEGETRLVFVPQFQQPGSDAYFMNKLLDQKVCLENVVVTDVGVTGLIRTLNTGFEKQVQVRYTTDKWMTYTDVDADYLPSSSDDFSDKFTFKINLPNALLDEKLVFSVRYAVNGNEYWDNNYSQDFVIKCVKQKVKTM